MISATEKNKAGIGVQGESRRIATLSRMTREGLSGI